MELTISTLIKIIIGVLVFVAVVIFAAYFFDDFIDFFKNLPSGNSTKEFLFLLK